MRILNFYFQSSKLRSCLVQFVFCLLILPINQAFAKFVELDYAINSALVGDLNYQTQVLSAQADATVVKQARALFKPTIDMSVSQAQSESDESRYDSVSSTIALSLTQPLYNRSTIFGLKQAEVAKEIAQIEEELAKQQLIQSVVNQYIAVGVMAKNLSLTKLQLSNSRLQYQKIQKSKSLGLDNKLNVLRAKSTVNSLVVELLQVRSDFEVAVENLSIVTDIANISSISIVEGVLPSMHDDLNMFLEKAEKHNLNIKKLVLLKQNANLAVDSKNSEYYPTLDASANYSNVYVDNPSLDTSSDRSTIEVGLSLTVPLYTGHSTSLAKEELVLDARAMDAELRNAKKTLKSEVRQLYKQLKTFELQMEQSIYAIQAATENYNLNESSFLLGRVSWLEVDTAASDLTSANFNLYTAIQQWIDSWLQIKINIGSLTVQDIKKLQVYFREEIHFN